MSWLAEVTTVFSRLKDRFRLRETPVAQQLTLLATIQPVTNVDPLLAIPRAFVSTTAVTGNGAVVTHTVPIGKRWRLLAHQVQVVSGTFTTTNVIITGVSGVVIDSYTSTTLRTLNFPEALPLIDGWTLSVTVDGYVGAGNLNHGLLIEEEDAY